MSRLLLIACALAGCGDNLATPDAAEFVQAPHASIPQVVTSGGPVLAAPEIVPIFFAGDDDMQAQLEAFMRALATSDYWTTTTSEYGVGPPTVLGSIVTADQPPTTDDDLQAWLEGRLGPLSADPTFFTRGELGWPQPTANTVYIVFLPAGVTLTAGSSTSCVTFGGYHFETSKTNIVYALLPRCPTSGVPIDAITPATSHELIEASTDPHPDTATAWAGVDDQDLVWNFTPGGEIGDMCEYIAAAYQRDVGDYVVQRTWSNASAAAGHDPCVPVLPTPFVGAAPRLPDITFDYGNGSTTTRGVRVLNGSTATIELDLFADAEVPEFTVGCDDVASDIQNMPAELSFTIDKTTGRNGDALHLTIKRLKVGQGGGSEFVVTAKLDDVTQSLWWGLATD